MPDTLTAPNHSLSLSLSLFASYLSFLVFFALGCMETSLYPLWPMKTSPTTPPSSLAAPRWLRWLSASPLRFSLRRRPFSNLKPRPKPTERRRGRWRQRCGGRSNPMKKKKNKQTNKTKTQKLSVRPAFTISSPLQNFSTYPLFYTHFHTKKLFIYFSLPLLSLCLCVFLAWVMDCERWECESDLTWYTKIANFLTF